MEVQNNLDINERFHFWDQKIEEAVKEEKIELSLMFESIREYVRNQRTVCNRMERTGQERVRDNFPDVVFFEQDNSAFGMDLYIRILPDTPAEGEEFGESVEDEGVKIGSIRFDVKTLENLPRQNVHPDALKINGEVGRQNGIEVPDPSSVEKKVMGSMVDILRGYDKLSFAYTPFVMMVRRATSLDLSQVHVDADPGMLTWKIKAVAGGYVMSAEMDFGAIKEYFNL